MGKITNAKAYDIVKGAVTGNIYKETFSDRGKRYANYYVDCAVCGQEIYQRVRGRGHTATNQLKHDGWRKIYNKWVCPRCQN